MGYMAVLKNVLFCIGVVPKPFGRRVVGVYVSGICFCPARVDIPLSPLRKGEFQFVVIPSRKHNECLLMLLRDCFVVALFIMTENRNAPKRHCDSECFRKKQSRVMSACSWYREIASSPEYFRDPPLDLQYL